MEAKRKQARASELYRERIAAGLCGRCGRRSVDGKTQCYSCREKSRQRTARRDDLAAIRSRRYEENIRLGRCVRCSREKSPGDDRRMCETCREDQRVRNAKPPPMNVQRELRQARDAAGLSRTQLARLLGVSMETIKAHETRLASRPDYYHRALIACGAVDPCQRCGERPKSEGLKLCDMCAAKRRAYTTERRHRLAAQGLCIDCKTAPPMPNIMRCAECAERMSVRNRSRRADPEPRVCAVCGVEMGRRRKCIVCAPGDLKTWMPED